MIEGGNWWRANEIVMRHLTRRLEARYRFRDKASDAADVLRPSRRSLGPLANLEPDRERVRDSEASHCPHERRAVETGDGRVQDLATIARSKPISESRQRYKVQRRNRSCRRNHIRRLIHAVTDFPRNSMVDVKWRKPVAMLINGGTRGGKEVLAFGFKEYRLGELVGVRTEGAVLAATAFLIGDNGLLLLAVEDVRVDGQRLEGVGVTPVH